VGSGTTELHVLRPTPRLDPAFLFYLTISHPFRSIGTAYMYGAGGQKRVPDDFVRDFRHPIPTIDEQRAIAAFLDRETARIDALIEKKRRQIELLHEKRAALISHVVTKGLDPSAPMNDSGSTG
jgi:type I restriction enzyme S subunit